MKRDIQESNILTNHYHVHDPKMNHLILKFLILRLIKQEDLAKVSVVHSIGNSHDICISAHIQPRIWYIIYYKQI